MDDNQLVSLGAVRGLLREFLSNLHERIDDALIDRGQPWSDRQEAIVRNGRIHDVIDKLDRELDDGRLPAPSSPSSSGEIIRDLGLESEVAMVEIPGARVSIERRIVHGLDLELDAAGLATIIRFPRGASVVIADDR